eukprot:TRINITY_DN11147_c0_g4_i2.p1 TRINITY_DN11147_c0_g4~~TRINITY_DN11147_c0_g4_i2.p1  ORF type:complete len:154 (-),score=10.98 TRINITY_DN11147_c0_g4_i2:282-743(-)
MCIRDSLELCDSAEQMIRSKRPQTAPPHRPPAVVYNESSAFVNGMPGYTGYRPRVRTEIPKSEHALDLASQSARAYVAPAKLPKYKRHGVPRDGLSEFRKTCLSAIGQGTPYIRQLGKPSFKKFSTNVASGEYFHEVHRPYGNRPTRGRYNCD